MDVFQLFLTNFLFLFVISRIFWQNYSFEAKSFGILSLIRIGRLSSEPYTFAVAGTAKKRSIYSQNFSSIQIIVAYYILMTVISYLLFCLPIFREPDSHVPFIDLFFLAISTVSVTGLTTVDINSVFNDRGIVLLEVLFQVGGLGIMMISTVFFYFIKTANHIKATSVNYD